MYRRTENAVPWEFLGSFLADTKKKIDTALGDMPESRLSYLEVKLFRKVEDESPEDTSPLEEYNLSMGEEGKGLCPDIEEEEEVLSELQSPSESGEPEQDTSDNKPVDVPQDSYRPTPAYELVRGMIYDIRNDLAGSSQVEGFAVGVRAIVSTNPDECTGFCCEKRKIITLSGIKYKWYLREYYWNASRICKRRWTSTPC